MPVICMLEKAFIKRYTLRN